MGNRYLVVSDLHLTDVEDFPGGWKAYKSSRYLFDDELDALVNTFVADAEQGDRLTLILNGDIVDFDLVSAVPDDPPWKVGFLERRLGLNPTEPKSIWKLQRVLADHPQFIDTLVDFIAGGHRLVYVMGNHDRELHFPGVQRAFIDAIEDRAKAGGKSLTQGTIRFESWFHYVPGEIYAEHGQQYDYYTSFPHLLSPVVKSGKQRVLALPMGNISNRYLMTRMGFFNPHAGDFILNVFSYVVHWLRHYAFTKRSLAFNWFFGSLLVIGKMLSLKHKLRKVPAEHLERLKRISRRFDLSLDEVKALGHLQKPPMTQRLYRMIRELWIDRVLIAALMTGGTVALALVQIPLWIKLMVPLTTFPLLYLFYEWATRGETIFTIEKEFPNNARAVAKVLPARVITFGHTHCPREIPLSKETTFVDTGTWAPIPDKRDPGRLRSGLRNYLIASFEQQKVTLRLGSWLSDAPGQLPAAQEQAESDSESESKAEESALVGSSQTAEETPGDGRQRRTVKGRKKQPVLVGD